MRQEPLTADRKPLIVLLSSQETSASVLYGLYDVLTSVGSVYDDMTVGEPGTGLIDVRIVSTDGEPFRCAGGVPVEPHESFESIGIPDAVVVCDMYLPINARPAGSHPEEISWLLYTHAGGALISSVCSGSILLAEAGLLDGHRATAHWAYRDMFQKHYPGVKFASGSMLCLAAEAENVVTAGGVSAWHDLAIYLITRFCGHRYAIETAKVFLISGHSEGQSPYAVMTRPMEIADAAIADCQAWIAENYAARNPVDHMIRRSGLNYRTFARRFRAATGYSPIEYVQALRIEEAKQSLEVDNMPVEVVGEAVGYDDPASFRRVFKRRVGLPPAAYRRKFQRLSKTIGPPSS